MDFSLGLRLGPRNKKAAHQEPPTPSRHGPPAASPCLSCPSSACTFPCPGCPPPTCSCTCPSYAAPCPSCPSLPGPPCTCSCPPCPACPPLTCPHTSCVPCSGPPLACCHPSPCPIYPCSRGRAACLSSHMGCSDSCGCGRGAAWGPPGSTGCCSCCFRGQRTSRGRCLIV
ncbi:keratin-associated protein 12-4 [Eulemur rufifrons]|uniref:keratin-associated protein 12-4 n=1 Tax=Eulemur rufifrons TaxID=859984 RepID=UPI003744427C